MKKTIILLAIILIIGNVIAQEQGIENPMSIQGVEATATVSSEGSISGELGRGKATLKVLSFQETKNQKISNLRETLEINGKTIQATREKDEYGNNYALFEISETGAFKYTITARIQTNAFLEKMEDHDLSQEITEQKKFLEATESVESDDAGVRTLALNKFQSNSLLETVRDISQWTNEYVTYDWAYYPETYSTLQVIESKKGVCDEFATLSTGMLRAKGIPARFVVGIVYSGEKWGYHAWNEAFNPNSGWMGMDSTYAETGLIDGTHIVMGYFPDPKKALDFTVAPTTAEVTVKPKDVKVELHSKKPFTGIVSLKAENKEIKAGQWEELAIEATNLLETNNIVPVQLVMPTQVTVEKDTQSVLLKPKETKTIKWRTRVDSQLQANQFLVGEYKIVSLQEETTREIKVLPNTSQKQQPDIEVTDIVPKIKGTSLEIQITLANNGLAKTNAKAFIKGTQIEQETSIEGLDFKTITLTIPEFENKPYELYIISEGFSATTTIIPQEGQEKPILEEIKESPESPKETIPAEQTKKTASLQEYQSILLLFGAAGAIAIILTLKGLLEK